MTIVWVKLLLLKEKIFSILQIMVLSFRNSNLIKIRVDKIDIHEKDLFIIVPDVGRNAGDGCLHGPCICR